MTIPQHAEVSEMLQFIRDVFPFCRSITGDGVRNTLARMRNVVPLEICEIATGTQVFDWTVPNEWNIKEAYIEGPGGGRILDFADNNLHVMNYSDPVDARVDLDELKRHLHTLPEQPQLVPYRTSYYSRDWAFCMSHEQMCALEPGEYRVRIDAEHARGHLTYGELLIAGETDDEILVYSHCCHPSIANDNLSGLAVSLWWAKSILAGPKKRYSYRFVWGPGTIGSITWLSLHQDSLHRIRHGLVTVLLGRPGPIHYKKSRHGNLMIDRCVERVLSRRGEAFVLRGFDPYGYDERQFCSPGIDLPVGRLTRVPHGEYDEYHTSGDNLDLISGDALLNALEICRDIGDSLDQAECFRNLYPNGEPQLGRRGLYRNTGGDNPREREYAMLWLLNLSDGKHSLDDIAEMSRLDVSSLKTVAQELVEAGVLMRS